MSAHEVVWFRRDLRLGDNPAWAAATQRADEVTALFVLDPALFDRAGPFRRQALVAHLAALDTSLAEVGGRLRIEHGNPVDVLGRVVGELGATAVHLNVDTTPYATRRDAAVRTSLGSDLGGAEFVSHHGTLVHEPGRVLTGKGTLSKVFTPFYKVWDRTEMLPWAEGVGDARVASEPGHPVPELDAGSFEGGERGAQARLTVFLDRVDDYLDHRDLPATSGTSELSGDLRFGTCLLYTSPSPRDATLSRMPSSA